MCAYDICYIHNTCGAERSAESSTTTTTHNHYQMLVCVYVLRESHKRRKRARIRQNAQVCFTATTSTITTATNYYPLLALRLARKSARQPHAVRAQSLHANATTATTAWR